MGVGGPNLGNNLSFNFNSSLSKLPGREHLRSADKGLYDVSWMSTSVGAGAFSVAGPQTWNEPPTSIRQMDRKHQLNKKLRHREEHSASVVLSWCRPILYSTFSGENLLMASQLHLRNWPQKLPQSRRNNANYTAITPFKVIEGHRFWYQSKAHMRLPISD